MYTFIEGSIKKEGNTVCNLLLYAIEEELKLRCYDKIYLFSDSCGGQNKNYLVLKFLSLLSTHFQLEIQHLFPVRGHSYCQCDRNFGTYRKLKKAAKLLKLKRNI